MLEGALVGVLVGTLVGTLVGSLVGTLVGTDVGSLVGSEVGSLVGATLLESSGPNGKKSKLHPASIKLANGNIIKLFFMINFPLRIKL